MANYAEDQIEFSILSLAKDPLVELIGKLATNVKCLEMVQERINAHDEAGSKYEFAASVLENNVLGPDESYSLTRNSIENAAIAADQAQKYEACTMDELMQHLQKLSEAQRELRATIKEEQQLHQADDDYAFGRRYDYGPAVRLWTRMLAHKGLMESLA